jgi:hypothetical protein
MLTVSRHLILKVTRGAPVVSIVRRGRKRTASFGPRSQSKVGKRRKE